MEPLLLVKRSLNANEIRLASTNKIGPREIFGRKMTRRVALKGVCSLNFEAKNKINKPTTKIKRKKMRIRINC